MVIHGMAGWWFLWNIFGGIDGTFMEYLWNIYGIVMEDVWNIYGRFMEYLWNINYLFMVNGGFYSME